MKTTLKNFAMIVMAVIALSSCQSEDPAPATRLTSIITNDGKYTISYDGNGEVSEIKAIYGVDAINYTFGWMNNNYTLIVEADRGDGDIITNTFEYTDVLVNGKLEKVIHKITYDDEGAGGKMIRIDYKPAPNESIPSMVDLFSYNMGFEGETGTATWTETSNKITLNYSTNDETVEIKFNNSISAWWTKLPVQISAVLFENEFYHDFHYPYFLSMKEVTQITNTYSTKYFSPDFNGTFSYQYDGDRITSITTNENTLTFEWK